LLHLGHRSIAFIGRTIAGKFTGRAQYIAKAFQTRLLSPRNFIDVQHEPPYTHLPAENLLARLLAQSSPPTAIIAWEDPIAALLINAAAALGVRVPRDVSILGFGNLSFASLVTPKLTTFEQHPEQVGREAFVLFSKRAREQLGEKASTMEVIAIRPTLIIRESCGPPPK